MATTEEKLERLKKTGKIDGLTAGGAKEVGRILDLHNDFAQRSKDKHFNHEMNSRNLYYWKLWARAMEAIKMGTKEKPVANKNKIIV